MLRLKRNVTYQKLNAIGFRLDNFNNCYSCELLDSTEISIDKDNKNIYFIFKSGYEIIEYDDKEAESFEQLYYFCPELKGLVEKVDDKQ